MPPIKRVLIGVCITWAVLALVIFALGVTGVIDKATFQWSFVIGFVVFAALATGLSQILNQGPPDPPQ